MDKREGFQRHRRRPPVYRPVAERLADHAAVECMPAPAQLAEQAERCMDCGTPFCHGYACPLRNSIPEINALVKRGHWRAAAELLLADNNFPEFTGRVCPALCEAACVLGINDEPVSIRQIELAVIEKAFEDGQMQPRQPPVRNAHRVAIIGSGPAGLAAADCLNQAGCQVTVYDGDRLPGGILRYGIPDFKLEKWVIDRRIDLMRAAGVEFEMQADIGRDISALFLRKRFDALCLAGGARLPRDLPVPGRELDGIHFALDYLIRQNLINAGRPVPDDAGLDARGRRVVIIGGGDTGADCVGTALRQGAAAVTQLEITPEPPRTRDPATPWPQWPRMRRDSSSHREGGQRLWAAQTIAFKGQAGHIQALQCRRVEWRPADPGRPPEISPLPGSEFEITADLALLAMGFSGPRRDALAEELQLAHDARGNLVTDARCMTGVAGVFAAGDAAQGASLVVHAIAGGRRCAAGILDYLSNRI